jgi:hypothetical protein
MGTELHVVGTQLRAVGTEFCAVERAFRDWIAADFPQKRAQKNPRSERAFLGAEAFFITKHLSILENRYN